METVTITEEVEMEATLKLRIRREAGKGVARRLRRAGRVPGIIYGGGGDNVLVSMEAHDTLRLFESIDRNNTILRLVLDEGTVEEARIGEIQAHPVRPQLLHVDFLRVGQAPSSRGGG